VTQIGCSSAAGCLHLVTQITARQGSNSVLVVCNDQQLPHIYGISWNYNLVQFGIQDAIDLPFHPLGQNES
jgi:hypothetical protein